MEEHHADDQSHYEISLTAGQAFLAFVLLLLSLAATFSFGLMIGRGQADERLVVRREVPIVTEGSILPQKKSSQGEIVEVAPEPEFTGTDTAATDTTSTDPVVVEEGTTAAVTTDAVPVTETTATVAPAPVAAEPPAAQPKPVTPPATKPAAPAATPVGTAPATTAPKPASSRPAEIQLISTADQKRAEMLAAKLIEAKFMRAYVQRVLNGSAMMYRVRVPFNSEAEAREALPRMREISPGAWVDVK